MRTPKTEARLPDANRMLSADPRALPGPNDLPHETETVVLDAPSDLVARYLELAAEKRALEDHLSFVRAELEMLAVAALSDRAPRGRFAAGTGAVNVRLQPTCVFDRGEVARTLQKAGRLADVATVAGPALARFLAKEPALAARLGDMVRPRKSVVMTAAFP